jgi:hypothetical protein
MRDRPDAAWTKIRNMPWTASLELRRLIWPFVRAQFVWHGVAWGRNWRIVGRPILQKDRGSRSARRDGERCATCIQVP